MSDLHYYEDLPWYTPKGLARLPEQYYGDAVASVVRAGIRDEDAMKIVDAVLGPLKLVSPKPEFYGLCDHTRFTVHGEWHQCEKNHDDPEQCGDPEHHRSGTEEWYEDDGDGRAFSPRRKRVR